MKTGCTLENYKTGDLYVVGLYGELVGRVREDHIVDVAELLINHMSDFTLAELVRRVQDNIHKVVPNANK